MNEALQVGRGSPMVSIGMPLYNEGRFLRETLSSLLAQDFADFELIISDNASEDATQQTCLEYATRDPRIRYYRSEVNLGSIENFNRVFRLSSGKYFMWASGHDLWAPTFISRCVEVLGRDQSVVLCYPHSVVIDRDGKELGTSDSHTDTRNWGVLLRFNLAAWAVGCAWAFCGLIRSAALKETRLMRPVIESDLVLLSELSLLGPFANIPEILFYPRNKWGDESRRKDRWRRFFQMLYPATRNRRTLFPYLGWVHEEFLAVKHAHLNTGRKALLMASVVPAYFSRYRIYLPRSLRTGLRSWIRRARLQRVKDVGSARIFQTHMKPWKAYLNVALMRVSRKLKLRNNPARPVCAMIDPTLYCNLGCPACPTGRKMDVRPRAAMKFEAFKQIIDEIGDYLFVLDLFNKGEPLLHRQLLEMVECAKKKNIFVQLSSNLSIPLPSAYLQRLVMSGLDRLVVGLDGYTKETYERYRLGGNFALVKQNLRKLANIKAAFAIKTPRIIWQFVVFRHNEHEIQAVRENYKQWGADAISILGAELPPDHEKYGLYPSSVPQYNIYTPTSEILQQVERGERVPFNPFLSSRRKRPACSWLYGALVIDPTGNVSPCCAVVDHKHDFGRKTGQNTLLEIWNNEKFWKARALFCEPSPSRQQQEDSLEIQKEGMALDVKLEEGELICDHCPIPNYQGYAYSQLRMFLGAMGERILVAPWREKIRLAFRYALMGFPHLSWSNVMSVVRGSSEPAPVPRKQPHRQEAHV
jgi:glycosyltransferase involved in cell wall biosynthesis/MoaA/NifB/PqqE/SkfB family radical SAM enzyme